METSSQTFRESPAKIKPFYRSTARMYCSGFPCYAFELSFSLVKESFESLNSAVHFLAVSFKFSTHACQLRIFLFRAAAFHIFVYNNFSLGIAENFSSGLSGSCGSPTLFPFHDLWSVESIDLCCLWRLFSSQVLAQNLWARF